MTISLDDTRLSQSSKLGPDFYRLWATYSLSELGSAIGTGALPFVAVAVLDVSAFQVTFLAALSALAAAGLALPLGSIVEYRRKRPVMIATDLVRFAALGSVPVAAALGVLSYWQLCVVGILQTTCVMGFKSSSNAHLKNLVLNEERLTANSRFETTFWTANTAGPPLGGALIGWFGPTVTLAVDAMSFLLSALGIRTLRSPEPAPPKRDEDHRWRRDILAGWRYIFAHRGLTALLWNSLVFTGCVMLTSPLLAVFMLRDLGLAPWQYGLALGLPGVGGILGAMCTKRLAGKFGEGRVLLTFGVLRSVWMLLLPLAPPGAMGLTIIVIAEFLLLFSAGVFNPTFATYRMRATRDSHMTRVSTAWSVSTRGIQPIFLIAGGTVAAVTNPRVALAAAAVVMLASGLLLPWRTASDAAV